MKDENYARYMAIIVGVVLLWPIIKQVVFVFMIACFILVMEIIR